MGAVKESVEQISEKIGVVKITMDRFIDMKLDDMKLDDMKLDDMKEEQKEKEKKKKQCHSLQWTRETRRNK